MRDNLRDSAIKQAAACARETYAGEDRRIDKAVVIALNGGVEIGPDEACVRSERDPEVHYVVRDRHCDCPDHHGAPGGRCKHRWALALTIMARTALAQRRD